MTRSIFCSLALVVVLSVASGCGDDDAADVDGAPIVLFDASPPVDAPIPDAAPPIDAQLFPLGEAVGVDTATIVGGPAFETIGSFANLQSQIDSGTLLLVFEWRNMDDPSGQDDADMAVGFYQCDDPDFNTVDNFDAENPDRWVANAASVDGSGNPTVVFDIASVTAGILDATSSSGTIIVPGLPIPVALSEPRLQGLMVAAGDSSSVHFLADEPKGGVEAMLSGAVIASTLGATPDISMGFCGSVNNLLDILALGCSAIGLVGNQPDQDRDGDGLEKLCDTCADEPCLSYLTPGELDAGLPGGDTSDGIISCCVDNTDGTPVVITGDDCWNDAAFADGYVMDLAIHGTRVLLASEVDPT